jgi:hypothetical protein
MLNILCGFTYWKFQPFFSSNCSSPTINVTSLSTSLCQWRKKGKFEPVLHYLNSARRKHMEKWKYISSFFALCARCRRVVSVTLLQLDPGERTPGTDWIWGWVCQRVDLDAVGREKNRVLPRTEPNLLACVRTPNWLSYRNSCCIST